MTVETRSSFDRDGLTYIVNPDGAKAAKKARINRAKEWILRRTLIILVLLSLLLFTFHQLLIFSPLALIPCGQF